MQAPTRSGLLEGRWRLLYTSRPGTASPIQQTFVGVDAFTVYQEILNTGTGVRVNNIVSFGPSVGQLKVCAPAPCGPVRADVQMCCTARGLDTCSCS